MNFRLDSENRNHQKSDHYETSTFKSNILQPLTILDDPKPDTAEFLVSAQISERNINNTLNMLSERDEQIAKPKNE